jgi:FlaA1/EpsC-like NDP-sugar epimerase
MINIILTYRRVLIIVVQADLVVLANYLAYWLRFNGEVPDYEMVLWMHLFYLLVHWGFALTRYPRSIFIVDSILLIFFLGGIRLGRRIYQELGHREGEKKVLIYGAGSAGEMIVRDMKTNGLYDYKPSCFD